MNGGELVKLDRKEV